MTLGMFARGCRKTRTTAMPSKVWLSRRARSSTLLESEYSLHLLGGQTLVGPDHADDGDVDAGEDVRGRFTHDRDADQDQQQRRDDEGVGAPQRQGDYPHGGPLS
jgi:hypothetical protein